MTLLDSWNNVHVIGAGGIGVSAVARLLQHRGKTVTGSDGAESDTTRELVAAGISVAIGARAENISEVCDLVIYSTAVPPNNAERLAAKARSITEMSYPEFLGELTKSMRTVAVSGTNGKSTTTAMLALMLQQGEKDPTVIVGSKVPTFPEKNLRIGTSDLFVLEACEHQAHFLLYSPAMIVLTNIEEDHLDYYRDLAHIRETFQTYIEKLSADGLLVVNADDQVSAHELMPTSRVVTYGMKNAADVMVKDVRVVSGVQRFHIVRRGEDLGEFALHVPGQFNVMNALAAATLAFELGVSAEAVRKTLADFTGIWRRFERVGERDGASIISDYGHHPTAIAGTLAAAHEFYEGRRVVLAFQPHHHNRTKNLFDEFVTSFDGADVLLLAEVYDVAGREEASDEQVSSRDLVAAVKERDRARGVVRDVRFAADLPTLQQMLEEVIVPNDVVLVTGAGDIYTIAEKLV